MSVLPKVISLDITYVSTVGTNTKLDRWLRWGLRLLRFRHVGDTIKGTSEPGNELTLHFRRGADA